MASEQDLVQLVGSQKRVWTAERVCHELDIDVCELAVLLRKTQKKCDSLIVHSSEPTGHTNKIWLEG